MKKTILTYGAFSSAFLALVMTLTFCVFRNENNMGMMGMAIGFGSMILAFSLIYFAILHYKKHYTNGHISFLQALKIGVGISLLGTACYIITWMIIFYNFIPDFFDKYAAYTIEQLRNSGASEAAIQKEMAKMAEYGDLYNNNPLYVVWATFLEIFPIGLLISLISAAIASYRSKKAQIA